MGERWRKHNSSLWTGREKERREQAGRELTGAVVLGE